MKTEILEVEDILRKNHRLMVPIYQRNYQWDEERLTSFWNDAEAKATELLENPKCFKHYMGALILSSLGEGLIATTPRILIIDGQQRLTTFQLFLKALSDVAHDQGMSKIKDQVEGYLFNKLQTNDKDKLTRFKLMPTDEDRELFHDIIEKGYKEVSKKYFMHYHHGRVPKKSQYRSLRAFYLFYKQIERFVQSGPNDIGLNIDEDEQNDSNDENSPEVIERRLEVLLKALLLHMRLVVIYLEDDDDAQVIFETLNSKGQPLLAMDLVRNNIFYRAKEKAEELHEEFWKPFDNRWWQDKAPNSRPARPRIDHFLAYTLAAETGNAIAIRELYSEYRDFANPNGSPRFEDVREELKLLRCHVPTYKTLEGDANENPTMAWLGRKFAEWQITTPYPIMFQMAKAQLPEDQQNRIARLIYSYIVRRAMCGLTQKTLNKVFRAISQQFLKDGQLQPSYDVLRDFFQEREGESSKFPSNKEFEHGILNTNIYHNAFGNRLKDILWEINLASHTRATERIQKPEGLWVEHVLPQNWNKNWPFPDGDSLAHTSDAPEADKRRHLLQTLGNLTLTTKESNLALGNKGFLEKREEYKCSVLVLNKWFIDLEDWAEDEIIRRGKHFAEMAVNIWPGIEE